MLVSLENIIVDGIFQTPDWSPSDVPQLDTKIMTSALLDLNPGHQWQAYTPQALSSVYERVLGENGTWKERKLLKDMFKLSIDTKELHEIISSRIPHVPKFTEFCEAIGTPLEAATAGLVQSHLSPDIFRSLLDRVLSLERRRDHDTFIGSVKPTDDGRDLFVSFPIPMDSEGEFLLCINTMISTHKEELRLAFTVEEEPSHLPGIGLSFPTTTARDIAYHNLKTNQFSLGGGPAFKVNVQYYRRPSPKNYPWIVALDSCEVPDLLEEIRHFIPHEGHVPDLTLHREVPNESERAVKVTLRVPPNQPWCVRKELKRFGDEPCYLTAECSEDCSEECDIYCPQEIKVVEAEA